MSSKSSLHTIIERPWEAVSIFLITFFILSVILYIVDFVPEAPKPAVQTSTVAPTVTVSQVIATGAHVANVNLIAGPAPAVINEHVGDVPTRVVIPKVGVDTPISNPTSASLSVLDDQLLRGAVRYPGTAYLGEEGSVVLFGHQSYLPIIHNQAFKAFNDVQRLMPGDIISVYAGDREYRYAVRTVKLVTTDVGSIALPTIGQTLTLVTCNSLGTKEERNIISADFIGVFNK